MAKQWRIQPHDPRFGAGAGARSASLPAVVAQLLVARGVNDARAAHDFLDAKLTSLPQSRGIAGPTSARPTA